MKERGPVAKIGVYAGRFPGIYAKGAHIRWEQILRSKRKITGSITGNCPSLYSKAGK